MKPIESIDLMIKNAAVVTMNPGRRILDPGTILVRDARIAAVLPQDQVASSQAAKKIIDAAGMVATPGLINAHGHLAMTLFRGFVEDLDLHRWLEKVWKYEFSILNPEIVAAGSKLAIAEMIRGGVTCAHDMYWHYETTIDLAEEIGFRLISGPPITGLGNRDFHEMVCHARLVLDRLQDYTFITPILQAHSTYTTDERMLDAIHDLKRDYRVPFTTHASENQAEVEQVLKKFGSTPIKLLHDHQLLDPATILAHCVELEDDEISLLSETGTNVAHCPESNLKLGSGIARISDMMTAGINVCIGTDGAASNNDLDLLGELRTAALLQKGILKDPKPLNTLQALEMATLNGAQAFGLSDLGSLEPGKKADIVLFDFNKLHLTPAHDVLAGLVYSASRADVHTVIINGRIHLEAGEFTTIDPLSLMDEVKSITRQFH